MSSCKDCQYLIDAYGAPDGRCKVHWAESHPNSVNIEFEISSVNPVALAILLGKDFS